MTQPNDSAPWVNGKYMSRFVGRTVRLVGQIVDQSTPGTVMLRTSDNQNVQVQIAPNSFFGASEFVEVVGIVQPPNPGQTVAGVIQEVSHVDYDQAPNSKPFSLENYDKLVQFSNSPQFHAEFAYV